MINAFNVTNYLSILSIYALFALVDESKALMVSAVFESYLLTFALSAAIFANASAASFAFAAAFAFNAAISSANAFYAALLSVETVDDSESRSAEAFFYLFYKLYASDNLCYALFNAVLTVV